MKKIFLVTLVAFALFFATSCTKEDVVKDAINDLKDTEWEMNRDITIMGFTLTLDFELELDSDMTCEMKGEIDAHGLDIPGLDSDMDLVRGTWSYEQPYVTLLVKGESIRGKVEGNTLTIDMSVFEDLDKLGGGDFIFVKK